MSVVSRPMEMFSKCLANTNNVGGDLGGSTYLLACILVGNIEKSKPMVSCSWVQTNYRSSIVEIRP